MRPKAILFLLCIIYGLAVQGQEARCLLDSARRYKQDDFPRSLHFAEQAYTLAGKQRNIPDQAAAALLAGTATYLAGNHDEALRWYLTAKNLYSSIHDTAGLSATSNEQCVLYAKQEKFTAANTANLDALTFAAIAGDTNLLASAHNNRGLYFYRLHQYDSSVYQLHIAYDLYRRSNNLVGMSYSLDYLATSLAEQGKVDEAIQLMEESRRLRIATKDKAGEAMAVNNLGELLMMQQKAREALPYFTEAGKMADTIHFTDLHAYTFLMRAQAYEQLGDYRKAYDAVCTYQGLHDQVLNEKRIKAIEELQARYETKEKDQENKLLQQRNSLQSLQLSRRSRTIYGLAALILLTAGVSYLLYNRYRLRQEARLKEELLRQQKLRMEAVMEAEEQERRRLARELHDGVGQLLSAARRKMQSLQMHDADAANEETANAVAMLDDSIREVRQLSHSMMPPALRNKELVPALKELAQQVMHTSKLEVYTDWVNTETLQPGKTQTLMLYRAVQEILQNIIKHAEANSVNIELVNHETELSLMVYDDGKGFDVEAVMLQGNGLGLKNIRSRVEYIGGKLVIDTSPGNGTTYIIELPVNGTASP